MGSANAKGDSKTIPLGRVPVEVNRTHLVTTKDVQNIRRAYGLKRVEKHPDFSRRRLSRIVLRIFPRQLRSRSGKAWPTVGGIGDSISNCHAFARPTGRFVLHLVFHFIPYFISYRIPFGFPFHTVFYFIRFFISFGFSFNSVLLQPFSHFSRSDFVRSELQPVFHISRF